MNFATREFLYFFACVFLVYWTVRGTTLRKIILLGASYVFYMSWDPYLVSLIWASTLLDYTVGRYLAVSEDPRNRRLALIASCVGNLGILGIFKYANFFIDSAEALALQIGFPVTRIELAIVLPVGISFYTFQTLSYTIDVYRRRLPTCYDFVDFALFVGFFPQLVAGPIVRASDFLPQLKKPVQWSGTHILDGAWIAIRGLAKKVVLADSLAIVADRVFDNPTDFGFWLTWLGVLAFSGQIYYDFSGYSDIAIGVARMLGYRLPVNFSHPYLARNVRDFWRRWHISLSTWLRDYLYIPLGGSRGSRWYVYRNLMITMLLGGLWHGANWTFVLWGAYHGLLLCLFRGQPFREQSGEGVIRRLWQHASTLALVFGGWVIFRASSLSDASEIIAGLGGLRGFGGATLDRPGTAFFLSMMILTHGLAALSEKNGRDWSAVPWVRAVVVAGCVVGVIAFWETPSRLSIFSSEENRLP